MRQYIASEKEVVKKKNKEKNITTGWYAFLSMPYIVLLFSLIVMPMLIIVFQSLTTQGPRIFQFTFKYYGEIFNQSNNLVIIMYSLLSALITTILCLLIGYPCAYFINKLKRRNAKLIILLITAPMWINMLLRTYALKQILDDTGPINELLKLLNLLPVVDGQPVPLRILGTETAVIIGSIYIFLPFMILPIYSVLQQMDKSYIEASNDLGSGPIRTFLFVTFPMSISGVLSGVVMVLLPVATTLVIPNYLGNTRRYTIGILIEKKFYLGGEWSFGSAISIFLALIIMVMIYHAKQIEKKVDRR